MQFGAPTKLTLRPAGDPTQSMIVGMDLTTGFRYSDGELEGIAFGIYPREHETYLTWFMLAPSDPALDVERAVHVACRVPDCAGLNTGRAERLTCRVDLVLGKRHTGTLPDWLAGVYTGTVSATARLSACDLHVDFPETELRCVGGGTGPLRVSGRVVVPRNSRYFDSELEDFAKLQASASKPPDPDPEPRQP
jgi:hypothetical protein